MIEIVPDALRLVRPNLEIAPKALDLDEYISIQPLNFQFYYAKNNQAEVVNTIYLEDGNTKLDLCLELFNESTESVTFQQGTTHAAGLRQCHFYIRFEKDLQLKARDISVEPAAQWQVNYDEDDYFFTLYFLHKSGLVLKPQNSPNKSDRVVLTLKNLSANNRAVKSTNVELIYGSLLVLNGEVPYATPFTEVLSCKNTISVTNHPEKKNIPLQFRFIGPNTILNDGTTVNNLKLKIFNRPLSNNSRPNLLLDKTNSRFIVSFEANDTAEALTNLTRANSTSITATDPSNWSVEKTQNAPEWKIKINSSSTKDKLTAEEGIELNISNLVTSSASGLAYLYITYQNIGDYPDGQLVVPIEKTPLLYRQNNVGIGTTNPQAKLEVNGNCKVAESLSFDAPFGEKINLSRQLYTIGHQSATQYFRTYKNFAWYKDGTHNDKELDPGGGTVQMVIKDGNVGIGTNSPSAKLHIVGSGGEVLKVNVNNNSDNNELVIRRWEQTGGGQLEIGTWKNGWNINTGTKDKHLYLNRDATGASSVYIGQKEKELTVLPSGNVGIGTTSPETKLHIVGSDGNDIHLLKVNNSNNEVLIRTWPNGGRLEFVGWADGWNINTGTKDKHLYLNRGATGASSVYIGQVGNELTVLPSGNVGIGTNSPSAKLDVHGDFHIKGRKPIEYRYYQVRQNNPRINTDYSCSEWVLAVAGFFCDGPDTINSSFQFLPEENNNKWVIVCRFKGNEKNIWNIGVLFIRKALATMG